MRTVAVLGANLTEIITESLTIAAGQTRTFTNEHAFDLRQPLGAPETALRIAGQVEATATAGAPFGSIAGIMAYGYLQLRAIGVELDTTGVLTVTSNTARQAATAIAGPLNRALTVVNAGRIEVTSVAGAIGISGPQNALSDLTNAGLLRVVSTDGEAQAVGFTGGGRFLNSGRIEVEAWENGTAVAFGGRETRFENTGTITFRDQTAALHSVGVYWGVQPGAGTSWRNAGTIEADYALKVDFDINWTGQIDFRNDGALLGRVALGGGAMRLTNAGSIRGEVRLEAGDDVYDGRAGTAQAGVYGDDGNDTLVGSVRSAETLSGGTGDDVIDGGDGAHYLRGDEGDDIIVGGVQFDDINGNMGNDTASSGAGDDWVVGGKDNDRLAGDAGGDIVHGNLGNDTCDGGEGNDIVRGGRATTSCGVALAMTICLETAGPTPSPVAREPTSFTHSATPLWTALWTSTGPRATASNSIRAVSIQSPNRGPTP